MIFLQNTYLRHPTAPCEGKVWSVLYEFLTQSMYATIVIVMLYVIW